MPHEESFFSERPYRCGPGGAFRSLEFRRACDFDAYASGFHIDDEEIPYERVLRLEQQGSVLGIAYLDAKGERTERYFKFDKFLPWQGSRAVRGLLERVAPRLQRTAAQANVGPVAARLDSTERGRYWVKIHGTRVAFPAICPTCRAVATRAAYLDPGALGGGAWVVPTCVGHDAVVPALDIHDWNVRSTDLTFSFASREYGEEFLALNERRDDALARSATHARRFEEEVRAGTRLVVYQYAVAMIYISLLQRSKVHALGSGASRRWRAMPYVLVTVFCGWWSLGGIIFTLRALTTNFRGGVDITDSLLVILRGQPVSAIGT